MLRSFIVLIRFTNHIFLYLALYVFLDEMILTLVVEDYMDLLGAVATDIRA